MKLEVPIYKTDIEPPSGTEWSDTNYPALTAFTTSENVMYDNQQYAFQSVARLESPTKAFITYLLLHHVTGFRLVVDIENVRASGH